MKIEWKPFTLPHPDAMEHLWCDSMMNDSNRLNIDYLESVLVSGVFVKFDDSSIKLLGDMLHLPPSGFDYGSDEYADENDYRKITHYSCPAIMPELMMSGTIKSLGCTEE